jgi:predicted AlkP superfamily pyrophosphatase or phosphodiesterase
MDGYRAVMTQPAPPNYEGRGLVNLVAELEFAMTGKSQSPRLDTDLADSIRNAATHVFVLFDGLGAQQLGHPMASDLAGAAAGVLDAPFPSTTTVSLATIATGLPPSQHGLIAYKMWMPDVDAVVNTIHMTTRWGEPIPSIEYDRFLPSPNVWERLSGAGVEPIVVQPGNFERTPLTETLYRGARFEGYWNPDEAVTATTDLAATSGRLVFLYVPHVDFAAHVSGQESDEYTQAMRIANTIWRRLARELPADVGLTGTADHGHVDIDPDARIRFDDEEFENSFVSEDGRVLFIHGEAEPVLESVDPGSIHVESSSRWWGPPPLHPRFAERSPDSIIFVPPGITALSRHSNHRLMGYHGGVTAQEREIPLLTR